MIYSVLSQINTEMGDRFVGVGLPCWYLNEPQRPIQHSHPSVGRCSHYWWWPRPLLGKKQWVLHEILLAYWSGPWKTLAVKWAGISHLYNIAYLGLTLAGWKCHRGMNSRAMDFIVCKSFLFMFFFFFSACNSNIVVPVVSHYWSACQILLVQ